MHPSHYFCLPQVDDDEVVVMSDIRPLEPDMVDLSDSSEDSLGEDEREEILQLEDLDDLSFS